MHDGLQEAGSGLKGKKHLFQIPDTDNLKLLIPASLQCAVKAMYINFMSSLNTSGSHCRRISLNKSGCPLFSVWLYCVTPAGNQTQMDMLYCMSEKQTGFFHNVTLTYWDSKGYSQDNYLLIKANLTPVLQIKQKTIHVVRCNCSGCTEFSE